MSTMTKVESEPPMVTGLHQFTLEKYSLCIYTGRGKPIYSDSFVVGGHKWAVSVFPNGTDESNSTDIGYLGICVTLISEIDDEGVPCYLEITLLDQSGEGNHETKSMFDDDAFPILMSTNKHEGYPCFIKRDVLARSSYLKDDCLRIICAVSVVLPSEADTDSQSSDDDVGVDFLAMLKSGECSDVVFEVKGEKFRAHKVILSARSSVFKSMFASNQREKIVITNVAPEVFKVLLHFIYSDDLPEPLGDSYAFGQSIWLTFAKLLEAAHTYNLSRLKVICVSHLWRSISLNRFAETLILADIYGASELKHLCFEYAANANFYAALVELKSFTYLEEKGKSSLLKELDDYLLSKGIRKLSL